MNLRAFIMLGVALVMAATSVFLAQSWLRPSAPPAAPVESGPQVVVARVALDPGTQIKKDHLAVVTWPSPTLPTGGFGAATDILGSGETHVVLRRIEANEPIVKPKISGFGNRASLSALIGDEMRATTIRVNDVNGVAGFVLPGDRVDVLLTRNHDGGRGGHGNDGLATDILLQNVKVLAVDQDANESRDKPTVVKAVTLEVTPAQTQKLVLAQQVGTLALALRNFTNSDDAAAATVTTGDLRIGEINAPTNPVAAPVVDEPKIGAAAKPTSPINVYRGVNPSNYDVLREPALKAKRKSRPDRSSRRDPASGDRPIEGGDRTSKDSGERPGRPRQIVASASASARHAEDRT